MIHSWKGVAPQVDDDAFVAWNAEVIGEVRISEGASVWFGATIRGDIAPIVVGKDSNVQDGAVMHVSGGNPCVLGEGVTVGHGAIVHSARIEDFALVGMGAVILDGAVIGAESIVGAQALVTTGKVFPPRSMIMGSPAKAVRELRPDEVAGLHAHAEEYVELGRQARREGSDQQR